MPSGGRSGGRPGSGRGIGRDPSGIGVHQVDHRELIRVRRRSRRPAPSEVSRPVLRRMPSISRRIEIGRDSDLERHDVRWIVSSVDARQLDEAANQQPAAGEEHHRETDLRHDERTAQAHVPCRVDIPRPSTSRPHAARLAIVGARVTKRRHQAEEHTGRDRDDERKREHCPIDADLVDAWECSIGRQDQCAARVVASDRNSRTPPKASNDAGTLRHTARASCSRSRRYRISRPRPAPRALRIAISRCRAAVRASTRFATLTHASSEHESNGHGQHDERRPDRPAPAPAERQRARSWRPRCRGYAARICRRSGRISDSAAASDTPSASRASIATRGAPRGRMASSRRRPRPRLAVRKLKVLRHHADHRVAVGHAWAEHGIERHRPTNDLRVFPKVPAPRVVAEKNDRRRAGGFVGSSRTLGPAAAARAAIQRILLRRWHPASEGHGLSGSSVVASTMPTVDSVRAARCAADRAPSALSRTGSRLSVDPVICAGIVITTRTRRSACSNGSGRSSTVFTTLKIAVLAPMPRASVSTAIAVNAGARRRLLTRVLHIAQHVLEPAERSRIAMEILHERDAAHRAPRREPASSRRQTRDGDARLRAAPDATRPRDRARDRRGRAERR